MNCDEMARDRLTVCEQELPYAFVCLMSISSNFLLLLYCLYSVSFAVHDHHFFLLHTSATSKQ